MVMDCFKPNTLETRKCAADECCHLQLKMKTFSFLCVQQEMLFDNFTDRSPRTEVRCVGIGNGKSQCTYNNSVTSHSKNFELEAFKMRLVIRSSQQIEFLAEICFYHGDLASHITRQIISSKLQEYYYGLSQS